MVTEPFPACPRRGGFEDDTRTLQRCRSRRPEPPHDAASIAALLAAAVLGTAAVGVALAGLLAFVFACAAVAATLTGFGWGRRARTRLRPMRSSRAKEPALAAEQERARGLLRLGAPVLPIVTGFAEPVLRVSLRGATVVLTIADGRESLEAAVYGTRVAAIRYRDPAPPPVHERGAVVAAEEFLLPDDLREHRYVLASRPDGWLLSTPDCPPFCLAALEP